MPESAQPHEWPASRELDAFIHYQVLKNASTSDCPHYSTDSTTAEHLRRRLAQDYNLRIVTGRTSVPGRTWFAQAELEPGHPTRVLTESFPLCICRLAMLLARKSS
ncbi:MAG: hypothetical protein HYY23_13485 [Verrucomicrobia bacterium]|nr:hypothetical protein [Verrucomicrobiota bacterium]